MLLSMSCRRKQARKSCHCVKVERKCAKVKVLRIKVNYEHTVKLDMCDGNTATCRMIILLLEILTS